MAENTTERYYASLEHARAVYEDEYFRARPNLMRSLQAEALFRAGFDHAFNFLWQRFVDAEADALRLHGELMNIKYPGSGSTVSSEPPK